jgi:membrane-associated protease RseP (regulator of RpoE activity)
MVKKPAGKVRKKTTKKVVKKKLDSKIISRKRAQRHPTKSKETNEIGSARGPKLVVHSKKGMLVGLLAVLVAMTEFVVNGDTATYYWVLAFGLLILIPNSIWARYKWTNPFVIPYLLTMVRTKKFVQTIKSLSHWGKIWEKICILGLFLGFGLAGVDFWIAREKGGWKRILILAISAIILFGVLVLSARLLVPTMPPLFEPLIGISIISFILLGFGGLSLAFMLGYGALAINALFTGQKICPSVAPVIPGVPIPGFGVAIPFIAWVSLGLILIIHEGSHGIMLTYYKKKLHSVGLLLAGIFPIGAFVEQDDNEFSTMNERERICVLSAGPAFNFLTVPIALILMILLGIIFAPMLNAELNQMYSGVRVAQIQETVGFCGDERIAPAYGKLLEGDVIIAVDNQEINSLNELMPLLLDKNFIAFTVIRNGVEEEIIVEPENFHNLGISRIGVGFESIRTDYEPWTGFEQVRFIFTSIITILNLLWILSFAVGMFNFLPSDPLDGGRIAKSVLAPYFGFMNMNQVETELLIGRLFAWLFLIAIVLNVLPYLTMFI